MLHLPVRRSADHPDTCWRVGVHSPLRLDDTGKALEVVGSVTAKQLKAASMQLQAVRQNEDDLDEVPRIVCRLRRADLMAGGETGLVFAWLYVSLVLRTCDGQCVCGVYLALPSWPACSHVTTRLFHACSGISCDAAHTLHLPALHPPQAPSRSAPACACPRPTLWLRSCLAARLWP